MTWCTEIRSHAEAEADRSAWSRYDNLMKILFLHGWQSIPGGVKPTFLAQHGHEFVNPALSDEDFNEAARIAQAEFDKHQPDVVVGSSRGGTVELVIRHLIDGSIRQTLVSLESVDGNCHEFGGDVHAVFLFTSSGGLSSASHGRLPGRPYAPAPKHRAKSPAPGIPGPAASGRSPPLEALRRTPCASAARPAPAPGASASAFSSTRPADAASILRTSSSLGPGCTR